LVDDGIELLVDAEPAEKASLLFDVLNLSDGDDCPLSAEDESGNGFKSNFLTVKS